MPDTHLFPASKIPFFFFTLSFLIASYYKRNKDVDLLCTLAGPYRKSAEVYIPLTVTAQSIKSRKSFKYETCSEISLPRTIPLSLHQNFPPQLFNSGKYKKSDS
jgi:hypothetical protein